MARNEIVLRLTVHAVGGLADCLVCGALVSFKVRPCEVERIAELRCPLCRSACEFIESSLVVDAVTETIS